MDNLPIRRKYMKTKYKGKGVHTSGWQSQNEFDNLLSNLDVSSLCFLNDKYMHDIRDFPNQFDLNHPNYQSFYKEILQRKKMIKEEIDHRIMNIYASESYQDRGEYFDSRTGLVLDENNNVLYSVAYTEDEEDIAYSYTNNTISLVDYQEESKLANTCRFDVYEGWKYYENLDEE